MVRMGGEDGAHVQGTEGAWAEGAQGVKGGDYCVRVLKEKAAGGCQGENGAERTVEGFDFELRRCRGKLVGVLRVKVRREVRAISSGLERVMVEPAGGAAVLRRREMTGRASGDGERDRERSAVAQTKLTR